MPSPVGAVLVAVSAVGIAIWSGRQLTGGAQKKSAPGTTVKSLTSTPADVDSPSRSMDTVVSALLGARLIL
jgi:hypothetical protein